MLITNYLILITYAQPVSTLNSVELWGIGTDDVTATLLVFAVAVNIIIRLDDVGTLCHAVEEELSAVVTHLTIVAGIRPQGCASGHGTMVTAKLLGRFKASCMVVNNLNEVIVAVGIDGDAHGDTVADTHTAARRDDLTLNLESHFMILQR